MRPVLRQVARALPVAASTRSYMKSCDGNEAAAYYAYAVSDTAFIYPITPSSPMGELVDLWANVEGRKNIFGQQLKVVEMQSEAGAAGGVHGAAAAGALTTTFTASQGLLLMLPNMYKIAGELMPSVFHIAARALASQALSIFGDHQDVMACRASGYCQLSSSTVQEAADLSLVAHISSLNASLPFLHFFDGFRISHEVSKIDVLPYEEVAKMIPMEKVKEHQDRALNPTHPHLRGTSQMPDIYMQLCEASNPFYAATPGIVQNAMDTVAEATGRDYKLFDYSGAPDATNVVITMGTAQPVCEQALRPMLAAGEKVGVLKVRLFRPWSAKDMLAALPESVKRVTVLDRTKEAGAFAEPLYLDVAATLMEAGRGDIKLVGGRYGLGSKEFTPGMAHSVYKNMASENPRNHFTIGINDDVNHCSLPMETEVDVLPEGTTQCMFYGIGGDGTVGANKDAIKIIGGNTDMYTQGYFAYGAHKTGGATVSHLRFGPEPIVAEYLVQHADFIGCHFDSYPWKYDMIKFLKQDGSFLYNCKWSAEEVGNHIPNKMKKQLAQKNAKFFIVDGAKVAKEVGLGGRISMVMQSIFFKLSGVLPLDEALGLLKQSIHDTFIRKGQEVVDMNCEAVDGALDRLVEVPVPAEWADLPDDPLPGIQSDEDWIVDVMSPMQQLEGDALPVSAFQPGGFFQPATTKYEKRNIGTTAPIWDSETCTQCNQCAVICPHAVIRPFVTTPEEESSAPPQWHSVPVRGKEGKGHNYRLQITPLDCTGCAVCETVCPTDSLTMVPIQEVIDAGEIENWDYALTLTNKKHLYKADTAKNTQFPQPLMEFSGACAGCGETPYVKVITQLFGERAVIANATGCSSIWGGSAPSNPYCTTPEGLGPAWGNSLFEDNAEYGMGMAVATKARREKYYDAVTFYLEEGGVEGGLAHDLRKWLSGWQDKEESLEMYHILKPQLLNAALEQPDNMMLKELADRVDMLPRQSNWVFGGDGWAYDIGFGGLDHVLASGEDINVLVMDTEMYSNTGGQASKSTPAGAIARFAEGGKLRQKKDLGEIAMTYGDVYVASCAMGADHIQSIKCIKEAEEFPGPSLIIGYAPCTGHNIAGGMAEHPIQQKLAVTTGYWPLYHYDPRRTAQGKNPFVLDAKKQKGDLMKFLSKENRYAQLTRENPEAAKELHESMVAYREMKLNRFRRVALSDDALLKELKKKKNKNKKN